MTIPNDAFSFDRSNLITQIGYSAADSDLLSSHADDIIKSILNVFPDIVAKEAPIPVKASTTAPLFTPGKTYHLNLSSASKQILIGGTRILVLACILNRLRVLDLTVAITDMALTKMHRTLTKLTAKQQSLIETIYQLKRENRSPSYWPSTVQISQKLLVSEHEVTSELMALDGKVVQLDKEKATWKVLF